MRPEPSPVTQMLIREIRAVKLLIQDVKEKMATLDIPEELEKKEPSSPT